MQQLMNMTQFNEKVKTSGTVFVKFSTAWCKPCRDLDPYVVEFEEKYKEKIEFYKVGAEQSPDIVEHLAIMSVPTMLIYNKGNCVKTIVGAQTKQQLEDALKGWL